MRVFSIGEVARLCQVAPRTASQWFDAGKLKGYRVPGPQRPRRVFLEDLLAFLRENGMPSFGLEDMDKHHILLVGLGASPFFVERLKDLLTEQDGFVYYLEDNLFVSGMRVESRKPETIVLDVERIGFREAVQFLEGIESKERYHPLVVLLAGESEERRDIGFVPREQVLQKPVNPEQAAKLIWQRAKQEWYTPSGQ